MTLPEGTNKEKEPSAVVAAATELPLKEIVTPPTGAPSLEEVGAVLRAFLLPCISGESLLNAETFSWRPNDRWTTAEADGFPTP